jgi:putative ABC transport system substrate-binding protein
MKRNPPRQYAPLARLISLCLTNLLLTACGDAASAKTYTIGAVNYYTVLEPVLMSFKAQMATLGYVEGKNITYIYHGVLASDPAVIDDEVKRLLAQKVDLLLTLGTLPTLAAKQAVRGTNIPVVFAPVINPVEQGIVESVATPNGNMTGVQTFNGVSKAMEWLLKLVPGTQTIYVPYHFQDRVAVTIVKSLPEVAALLGVKLVLDEVHAPEDVMTVIESLPKDAAILFIPAPGLASGLSAMRNLAMARSIPAGMYTAVMPAEDVLFSYSTNPLDQGQRAARLVDQILKGKKPANLLVETAEFFLSINLKLATNLGLDIPDAFLRQADRVIR